MEVGFNQRELVDFLAYVSKFSARQTPLEAVKGIKLTVSDDAVVFEATDLEVLIRARYPHEAEREGSGTILLPPKFVEAVKSFPAAPITLEVEDEQEHAMLRCERSNIKLYCGRLEDFPAGEDYGDELAQLRIDGLDGIAARTVIATSKTKFDQNFKLGVNFAVAEDRVSIHATDTYRLVEYYRPVEVLSGYHDVVFLLPAKALNLAATTFRGEPVTLGIYRRRVTISNDDNMFFVECLLFSDKFPDLSSVFPAQAETAVRCSKIAMREVLSRAAMLQGQGNLIELSLTDKELNIAARSVEGELEETLTVEQGGADIEKSFWNGSFLLDGIKVIGGDELQLEMNGPLGAMVFVDQPDESEQTRYLVLPIKTT